MRLHLYLFSLYDGVLRLSIPNRYERDPYMSSMRDRIYTKITAALTPEYLSVEDESHGHNVPAGAESHFKVVVAALAFQGLSRVKRHQSIYAVLEEELAGSVHALALHLYTPEQWQEVQGAPVSPNCLGGSKGD